jgi:glycosyltransferase involved in cell wall biosynthesis
MPKVSVIIPAYNRANLVGDAIRSVLNQTFTDFEIIVVDDGSTDNTREVVNSFKDPRLKYIYQEHGGASTARSHGTKVSSGEYIILLDSDDILLESMLEKSAAILDEHPEVGYSYGQSQIMKVGEEVYRIRKPPFHTHSTVVGSVEQVRHLLFGCHINIGTLTVRRQCIENIGDFRADLWHGDDYHFHVRLAKKYAGYYIAEPLAIIRFHQEQTQKMMSRPGRDRVYPLVLQEVFDDPYYAQECQDIRKKVYSFFYRYWFFNCAYPRDMKLARHYLRLAIRYHPGVVFSRYFPNIVYKYLASFLPSRLRMGLRSIKRFFWYTKDQRFFE